MKPLKKYALSIIISLLGLACLLAFELQGSYVAADGTLVENFALIPLFWLAQFLAIITAIFNRLRKPS